MNDGGDGQIPAGYGGTGTVGRQQGQALVLHRQVTRRFGEDTAGQMSPLLDETPGPEDVDRVTDALLECATGDEFIEWVRMG